MAGTPSGGRAAAATNKARYGLDFYGQIGRRGGKISRGGGFAANHDLAIEAGRLGGLKSRKLPKATVSTIEAIHDNPEYIKHISPVSRIRNLFHR